MESTKKSNRKSGSKASDDKIKRAYKEHLLREGKQPASVYKFCLDVGLSEDNFYDHFASFEGLEKSIWKDFIDHTETRLSGDKSFVEFSTREKALEFLAADG